LHNLSLDSLHSLSDELHELISSPPAADETPIPPSAFTGFRLLVLGEAKMTTFPLPAYGQVCIGREADCEVLVDEPGIAGRHALLRTGGTLELVDCGSGATTMVGSRRLLGGESSQLAPGVVMLLGGVTMVVQASGASTRLRHVRSHDYFEARLEDECARAEAQGLEFAVARLRFVRAQAQAVEDAFSRHLRPVDLVAMYAADEYELLLTDTRSQAAAELCARICEHVRKRGLGELTLGLAHWPRTARSPETLLAAAGLALHGQQEQPVSQVPASGAIEALRPLVERVAVNDINVLILGETGVGKEVLARRIHELSPRAKKPMLAVNCAALSDTLLESELFGHERGAFTGAVQAKPGLLEVAEGGSVFFDEIGEMPLVIQAKLLRVVEERSVTRVGGLRARLIDVRFMAATHRDLEAEIQNGNFRQDLYYRLNGVSLMVPPLRERTNEIRTLSQLFVNEFAQQARRKPPTISSRALALLDRYAWPGNVRELRNVMQRAVMLCQADEIDLVDLPTERLGRTLPRDRGISLAPRQNSGISLAPEHTSVAPERPGSYSFAPGAEPRVVPDPRRERDATSDERERIIRALERCGGNQTHAARELGISRRTLISRIERYDLPRPRKRDGG
jgi:transcriptional regulator with GAF, ATPase, and Fis domain